MNMKSLKKCLIGICITIALVTMGTFCVLAGTENNPLAAPESAGWSKVSEMTASWKKVEDANGYQLKLYRDEQYLRTVDSKTNKMDLSEYMVKEGEYYYEVRAVVRNTRNGRVSKSSEYMMSETMELTDLGDTEGSWKNYTAGKKYRKEDKTYATAEWYKIRGKWYYFDANSYMMTGWIQVGGPWYYMGQDGVMQTGWIQVDGATYYLKEDGAMATGWVQYTPSTWYYFYDNGSMAVNTVIDGYVVNEKGIWVPN